MENEMGVQREERWREIEGAPGYEVSDLGRVRTYWKSWGNRQEVPTVMKLARVKWSMEAKVRFAGAGHKRMRVHRLVLTAFRGPCPPGCEGCHNDGNVENNSLENLRWDTHRNNIADKAKHNTNLFGDKHPNTRLKGEDREFVKELLRRGFSRQKVAGLYGVHVRTVANAMKREARELKRGVQNERLPAGGEDARAGWCFEI